MILLFYFLFSIFFFFITWRRFEHGVFLFFLLLPTYLIRFPLFGIPTTLLESMFWILFGVWLSSYITYHVSHSTQDEDKILSRVTCYVKNTYKKQPLLFTAIFLFLLGATISIFTSVDIRTALGEWKAFYVEPVILFLILVTTLSSRAKRSEAEGFFSYYAESERTEKAVLPDQKGFLHAPRGSFGMTIVLPLLLCGLTTSLLAIYQHFTGWMVPHAFWANKETYRVTAWYGFPNGVGLFLAPLVPLAIGIIVSFIRELMHKDGKSKRQKDYVYVQYIPIICSLLFIPYALIAILFAKSTGALIGIAAGIVFLLLMSKKTRWPTMSIGIIGLICLLSIPDLKPIRDELFFQDRSGQIRLAIYKETFELLKDRPILGAGLASYEERIAPYHGLVNGESIEIFHHPHNIFLTMWVNTGLIGLIGFLGILTWVCCVWYTHIQQSRVEAKLPASFFQSDMLIRFFTASMITLLIAGLVDSPYIKNDLAFLFWAIIVVLYINTQSHRQDITTHIQ